MTPVDHVKDRIAQAAARVGRSADSITLIAVSKTRSVEEIRAVYNQGLRHFGENRTEELAEKRAALVDLPDIKWHFIGRLQSRQTNVMAANTDVFHAVDRLKIAEEIGKHCDDAAPLRCFVQVNVSGEESKAGFEASEWDANADQRAELIAAIRALQAMKRLSIQGLMTMAPYNSTPDVLDGIFTRMRMLSDHLRRDEGLTWSSLSMGMSGDFEAAIAHGATHVRIGSALFGEHAA